MDADFFDGEQFDAKTKAGNGRNGTIGAGVQRHQACDPVGFWATSGATNEWDVKPRSEDDAQPALTKAKLIKYVDDINNARFERSEAFAAATKTGEGWTQVYITQR